MGLVNGKTIALEAAPVAKELIDDSLGKMGTVVDTTLARTQPVIDSMLDKGLKKVQGSAHGVLDRVENLATTVVGSAENVNRDLNKAVDTVVKTADQTGSIIKTASEQVCTESGKWGDRYDTAADTLARGKAELTTSAARSFGQAALTGFAGKLAYGVVRRCGGSKKKALFLEVFTSNVTGVLYQCYLLNQLRPDVVMVTLVTQTIAPLAEHGLRYAGYDPAQAMAFAAALKTGAQVYTNPIEGLANIAGNYLGNAGGAYMGDTASRAVFGVVDQFIAPKAVENEGIIASKL